MIRRHRGENGFFWACAHELHAAQHIRDEVAVAQNSHLGASCGARGEEQDGCVFGVGWPVLVGSFFDSISGQRLGMQQIVAVDAVFWCDVFVIFGSAENYGR